MLFGLFVLVWDCGFVWGFFSPFFHSFPSLAEFASILRNMHFATWNMQAFSALNRLKERKIDNEAIIASSTYSCCFRILFYMAC